MDKRDGSASGDDAGRPQVQDGERKAVTTCDRCGGEGMLYTSRYGGNDPDVWPTGECPVCDGTGYAPCPTPLPPHAACPFCSSADTFVERADLSSAYVMCNACGARGPVECQESDDEETPGEANAIAAWNQRAPSEPATVSEGEEQGFAVSGEGTHHG